MINLSDLLIAAGVQVLISLVVNSAFVGFLAAIATLYILSLFQAID